MQLSGHRLDAETTTPRMRGVVLNPSTVDLDHAVRAGSESWSEILVHFALTALFVDFSAMSVAVAKLLPAASTACLACAWAVSNAA